MSSNKTCQEKDAERIEHLAHNFKSVVGIFSAKEAVKTAHDLERAGRNEDVDSAPLLFEELQKDVAKVLQELQKTQKDKANS